MLDGELNSVITTNCPPVRAPGCEKKVVQIATDYEQKKLLATRAMQSKPMGEPRTPNSVWSGLGFSSSMPEAVIREKMAAEHARAKQQREKEVASNSDWFGQSNAFDSMLAPSGKFQYYCIDINTSLMFAGQETLVSTWMNSPPCWQPRA